VSIDPIRRDHRLLIAGAGGFIGGHLVGYLRQNDFSSIRAVDRKPMEEWFQVHEGVESLPVDVSLPDSAEKVMEDVTQVVNLAADMGGMGFIETNKALCMLSVITNTHLLQAAERRGVERFFYASSACVYAADKQVSSDDVPLKESDAYPAMPEDGYGWEKLFSERMCRHFREDFGLETRVARYHNVYGPQGTWSGGREKAPAAICRKVAEAKLNGTNEIEIWGDGSQRRSFMFIDDCLYGTLRILESDFADPINLGSSESVTVDELVSIVEDIAGVTLTRRYVLDAPKGVNGRNSDNTLIRSVLDWEPSVPLRQGLEQTFRWVFDQVSASLTHR
jgi:GDP-D-mannose 3',5'-epimerase